MPLRSPMWCPDPMVASAGDIDDMNSVFTEAFTDRYRKDGLSGVRVPRLNPLIWRFALAVAGEGALLWRDRRGAVVGFNIVHRSGGEGWMGPLAVIPEWQGRGLGAQMVERGVDYLDRHGVTTVGLETMPRTVENIGFYSRLGFEPGHLTITLARELDGATGSVRELDLGSARHAEVTSKCRELLQRLGSDADYSREIVATGSMGLGGLSLVEGRSGTVDAFGLWHAAPLAGSRTVEDIRVLKAAAQSAADWDRLVETMEREAAERGGRRLLIRSQTDQPDQYTALLRRGYRVHWTDLRMYLRRSVPEARGGVLLSNWEI